MKMKGSSLMTGGRQASGHLPVCLCVEMPSPAPLVAQTPGAATPPGSPVVAGNPSGHWKGTIQVPGTQIGVDLEVVSSTYSGVLNAEGTELMGALSQGPASVPVTLRRAATDGRK
jgi:hypothetical protein